VCVCVCVCVCVFVCARVRVRVIVCARVHKHEHVRKHLGAYACARACVYVLEYSLRIFVSDPPAYNTAAVSVLKLRRQTTAKKIDKGKALEKEKAHT